MARKLRVQYPGTIYHLMNRGDRREPNFRDDHDRQRFHEPWGKLAPRRAGHAWIAHRLDMGVAGYAAQFLRKARK